MRRRGPIAAAFVVALVASRGAAADDVLPFIKFKSHSTVLPPANGQPLEIDIDSVIDVTWQLDELYAAVARREGAPLSSPLLVRLNALAAGVRAFLDAQDKLIALQAAAVTLSTARKTGVAAQVDAATKARDAASGRFSQTAGDGLRAIGEFRTSDPELYGALSKAVLNDYADMARVLRDYLQRASDELAGRLTADRSLQVLMTANLVDSAGRTTPLHLDGYDSIATGDSVPFARFQAQLDARTLQEFEAARALAPVVTEALNGTLGNNIKASLAELETSIRAVPDTLKSTTIAVDLEKLANDLTATGKSELQPVINDVRQLKDTVTALSQLPALTSGSLSDPAAFALIAGRLADVVKLIQKIIDEVPRTARTLLADITSQLQQSAPALVTSARTTLTNLADSVLAQNDHLRELVTQVRGVVSSLGLTSDVARDVDATSRRARDVRTGGSLDTSLDLTMIKGDRHPGDIVNITATVRRGTGADVVTLFQGRQAIRVEKYGWYSETRGALLFVQPLETLTRSITFQPAPAVGYYWHYGAKNRPAVNHELALGIGATLTMLDFDDQHDLELGAAVGVTFLHDLFWAGAGRNLQAQKNYYYLGINPLVLTGLLRR